jgi:hypothetical protein
MAASLCGTTHAETNFGATFTNSIGMEFVRIVPGTFTMGVGAEPKPADNGSLDYDEQPAHPVTLTYPFYILKSRLSQAEYQQSEVSGSASDISWNNAAAFCAWLSRREGRAYRLPTEAEWDYVRQNPQGVADMGGREWVRDWHGIFPADPVLDPMGPVTGMTRVVREGARRLSLPTDTAGSPWGLPATAFRVVFVTDPPTNPYVGPPPFSQAAIKQSTAPALQGPDPRIPYFTVRFALPIPPENDTGLNGPLTGLDPSVMAHQHSPGFEILPNGDVLAIYFSAKDSSGNSENDNSTRFVQARLRYGAEEWDPPELFCDFKQFNDQSGLLWTDGNTVRFFGGGREVLPGLPFKMGVSTNNGATWTITMPYLDAPASNCTPQPIVNAFRGANGAMYFAMDGAKDESFLWRSTDDGIHWHDMGGRTGGRHSTIVPLDDKGTLLSIGGKNTSVGGWSPRNTSTDWGTSWKKAVASPFPALGGNQRPCLIRLENGHLCFVSDSYNRKSGKSPDGWTYGQGCFVAISKDNGNTWRIKRLPVELPHEADRKNGTVGYATVRQAPNGVIHVLATMTQPCLHYEFNEAWVYSDAGDIAPENSGGAIRSYRENYPSGVARAVWSARICPNKRYLLSGTETTYYENGRKEHEVTYVSGRKTGQETFWVPDGTKLWGWTHHPESNTSTWIHYWDNGRKRIESTWNTKPQARDLNRSFFGLVANGPAYHWSRDGSSSRAYSFTNGWLAGSLPLPVPQP